jgi:pre-mRNA-processing factor 19
MVSFSFLSRLSKSRKKRPIPDGWVTAEEVAEFTTESSTSLPFSQVSALTIQEEGSYAAISSAQGDTAIYSVDEGKVERQLAVNEPVTDEIWTATKLIVSTAKGSVKVYDSGREVASLTEHAGPATGLALHPSGEFVASVGADKLIVFYDIQSLTPVGRCYTDSGMYRLHLGGSPPP